MRVGDDSLVIGILEYLQVGFLIVDVVVIVVVVVVVVVVFIVHYR